jgi:hypothetical protein
MDCETPRINCARTFSGPGRPAVSAAHGEFKSIRPKEMSENFLLRS